MFSESLKKLRTSAKMTQQELADKVGMAKSTISMLEGGKRAPSYETLEAIADIFNVDMNTLMGWENANGEVDVVLAVKDLMRQRQCSYEEAEAIFDIITNPSIKPLPKTYSVPRLGTIACGTPILAVENHDGYDDVPENIHCDFSLKCKGDSMIGARIHDGDVVYIRQQPEVENGQIAAVLIDNEATLKRFYISNDIVTLAAENPTFPPITVTSAQECRIIGLAVGFTSLIK